MKRIITWLFMLAVMLVSMTSAYAASLPERTGDITDSAGLFSPEEQARIHDGIATKTYELLLLTASGLDEQEGESLANQAYDTWQLGPNQVILVVTVNPNHVHLVFENQQLADLVSRSEAGDVKGVLDLQFVPHARDGNVADGVVAVSDFLNSLPAAASTSPEQTGAAAVPQPAGSGHASSGGESAASPRTPVAAATPVEGREGMSMMTVLLVLLIAVLVFIVVKQLVFGSRLKKLLAEAKEKHAEVTPMIDRMIVSELFRELEIGLIAGETKRQVNEMEQEALRLHQESKLLRERLDAQKVAFFAAAKTEAAVKELRADVQIYADAIAQTQSRMTEMERLSREVREAVENAKERATQIDSQIEALAGQTSFSLVVMRRDMEQTMSVLKKADQLDEFDYVQAEGLAKQVHEEFDGLQLAVEELRRQIELLRTYLPRIKEREEELRLIVGREQLLLVDDDPFAMLRSAEAEIPRLRTLIEEGHAKAARECADRIENGLQEASDAVATMIQHRDFSSNTVKEVNQLLTELGDFQSRYTRDLESLRQQYAEVHLQKQNERYRQIREDKAELERLLIEIRAAIDERAQNYKAGFEKSETAQHFLSRVRNIREQLFGYRRSLEEKVWAAKDGFGQQKSRFYQAVSLFEQLRVRVAQIERMITQSKGEAEKIEAIASSARLDVYRLEEAIDSFVVHVDELVYSVEQIKREKEETLLAWNRLQDEFTSRSHHYGRKIRISSYSARMNLLREQVEGAIAEGLFAEAMRAISSGNDIVEQMHRDYLRKLEEERRRNHSGGSGGGFGGGRSSGSSGWGGGGRSSGSTGWGGGGRSSGSSSWGGSSGGGRSSGSSSW